MPNRKTALLGKLIHKSSSAKKDLKQILPRVLQALGNEELLKK